MYYFKLPFYNRITFTIPNYNTHIIFYSLIVLIFFYINLFLDTIPSKVGFFISYYYFFDRDMLKLVEFEKDDSKFSSTFPILNL